MRVQLGTQRVESVLSSHVGPKGTELKSSALVASALTPEPSYQPLHFHKTQMRTDVVTAAFTKVIVGTEDSGQLKQNNHGAGSPHPSPLSLVEKPLGHIPKVNQPQGLPLMWPLPPLEAHYRGQLSKY